MGERHRLRQAGDAFLQPIEMAREKFVGVGETRIKRHGEHGAAARFAHLQTESSRPRAPSQHHGDVEAADFDLDGLAAREIQTLKHWYAPYCRRSPNSAASTVAQALEGALASALGSPAEGPRQHAFPALVGGYEIADFRRYFGAKTGTVEHAIMADAGLKMVRARGLRQGWCTRFAQPWSDRSRKCRPSRLRPSSAPHCGSCSGRPGGCGGPSGP